MHQSLSRGRAQRVRKAMAAAFATLLLTVITSGCASMRYHSAYNEHINSVVASHVYDMPIDQLWPSARTLLFEMGYQVRESDPGVFVLETEWLRGGSNNSTNVSRYLVQGTPLEGNRSQVQFIIDERITPDSAPSTGRDLGAEWALLQRVDPNLAARIESDADAAGNRAATSE